MQLIMVIVGVSRFLFDLWNNKLTDHTVFAYFVIAMSERECGDRIKVYLLGGASLSFFICSIGEVPRILVK